MKIILGSGSRFRKEFMAMAGYDFDILIPDLDERSVRTEDPYQLPLVLSRAKAGVLLSKISEPSLLITSDTIVICAGKVYEKPLSADEVRSFIHDYNQVKITDVVTTILVTNTETRKESYETDIAQVAFSPIPDEAIEEFIKNGDPYSRAGGFSIENEALAPYIKIIKGTRESIMGLPDLLPGLLKEAEAK